MCYRPANAASAVKCLECGGFNKPDNEVCQKCGADLAASKEAVAAKAAAAPAAPAAPISLEAKPAVPKPPTAPKPE